MGSYLGLSLIAVLLIISPAFGVWPGEPQISIRVIDENSVAVAGAQLVLRGTMFVQPVITTSDEAGRFRLPPLPPGLYEIKVEKPGYYAFISSSFEIAGISGSYEIVINHLQEFEETVNVVYSAPIIDRQEASAQTTMTSEGVIDLPFSATHDFRQVLPLMPGIVKGNDGRMYINGGDANQALYTLDGFNITSPVSGYLENRISVDAIRNIRAETSRYSAEYGKGSAGTVALETSRGDDTFRFSATNFIPSFQVHQGVNISDWTPRATFSGPIVKSRAWFLNATDLQYELNIVDQLPVNANTNRNWHGSNFTRLQVNLTPKNILTSSYLINFQSSEHWGISPLDPVETSRNIVERFYLFNLKDQAYLGGGWVIESGIGMNRLWRSVHPQGDLPYMISPGGRSGNYFESAKGREERVQLLTNILPPPWSSHGRHMFKFGLDANRIRYRQYASRRTYQIHRLEDTLSRMVNFSGDPMYGITNSEFSAYVQDRWSPNQKILVEGGLRLDWYQIFRTTLLSPRLAMTWGPGSLPDTKLSAGIGILYDAVNLDMVARPLSQQREDTFFDQDGRTILEGPIYSSYVVPRKLNAPMYLNWSLGWEQKLPHSYYLRTNFIRRQGRHGWAYNLDTGESGQSEKQAIFTLAAQRRDTFGFWEFSLSRTFSNKYPWFFSYARSSARSNAVIDYSPDNPVFGLQGGGPLDWDTPNRLLSWAFLPAPFKHKFTIAYAMEWHSGFPYSVVDEVQKLVGLPNSRRFPDFFSLNLHFERRFHLWKYQWALRAGFNNLTGHLNPTVVNNNITAPDFGQFGGGQKRTFTGRVRFLGKS